MCQGSALLIPVKLCRGTYVPVTLLATVALPPEVSCVGGRRWLRLPPTSPQPVGLLCRAWHPTASDIIRAWKDPSYRAGLPATQRAQLPAHPAGAIELADPTLHAVQPTDGFRVKSGIRAGLAGGSSNNPLAC